MGEELNYGNFFMIRDDGTWVPFEGIKPSCAIDVDAYFPDLNVNANEQFTLELNMKIRKHRKFLKLLKKQSNSIGRQIRRYKRQKERARRIKLKENGKTGAKVHIVYQDEWIYRKE